MRTYGNVSKVKSSIKAKYQEQIDEIRKEAKQRAKDIRKQNEHRLRSELDSVKTKIEGEVQKAYARVLSEETLSAKKEYEELREELINNVFSEAEKKAAEFAHSKEYLGYVKQNLPKSGDVVVSDEKLQKEFPGSKVDRGIVGVKCHGDNIVYDLTVQGMLDMKQEMLRQNISRVLFNG